MAKNSAAFVLFLFYLGAQGVLVVNPYLKPNQETGYQRLKD